MDRGIALRKQFELVMKRAGDAVQNFLDDPAKGLAQMKKALDGLMEKALAKARDIGNSAAGSIFEFLELPFGEMGEKVGQAVGVIVINVVLAVASAGIGEALTGAGRLAAEISEQIATKAAALMKWMSQLAGKLVQLVKNLGETVLTLFKELFAELIELLSRVKQFFAEVGEGIQSLQSGGLAMEGGPKAPPGVLMSEAAGGGKALPAGARKLPTTVADLRPPATPSTPPKGGGAPRTSRVEPYEKAVDKPYQKQKVLEAPRKEFANDFRDRSLPKGSEVSTTTIERTEAGRAQSAAVTPTESAVAMDVELKIKLPDGTTFKPDGVKYLNQQKYLFQEHKEILTIWERSHYSREVAARELEIMLQQRADIFLKLKDYGCVRLPILYQQPGDGKSSRGAHQQDGGSGRAGLLAPPL